MDEVGQLPLRLQAKLLRVLQERSIRRLGGTKETTVNVRIVAATALNLEEEVRQQRFRLDFYHRINVARVELPPLRERGEDILLLARHFLDRYRIELDKGAIELSPEVSEVLTNYSWPGNVRELQNVLKRALAVMRHETLALEDLPDEIMAGGNALPDEGERGFLALRERRIAAFENDYFRNLLATFQGDASATAREARLTRGSLYRFLNKHGLQPADFRPAQGTSSSDTGKAS